MKIINWIKSHKVEVVFILLIIIIGGFFRFYEVGDFMHYGEDEARDSFVVRSIVRDGDIQLLGPSTSPGDKAFSLGPAFYYLLAPAYWLSNNSPTSGAILTALLSFFSIGLLYFIVRKWFGVVAAVTSSFLYSVSWIVIYYGRWVWNPNLIPFFILAFIISLYYLVISKEQHKKWWLFSISITFSILTQLHGTALFILPLMLILYFVIFRPKIKWQYYIFALLIVVIFYSPLIVFDLQNNFFNTNGFIDLLTKQKTSDDGIFIRITETFSGYFDFYDEALSHQKATPIFIIIFASSIAYLFYRLKNINKKKKEDSYIIILLLWLFVPFIVFIFFNYITPPHYFSIVFPLIFILVGALMTFFIKFKWLRLLIIITPIIFGSILIYSSSRMLIDIQIEGTRESTYQIIYSELEQVKDYIINDSKGQNYQIRTIYTAGYDRSIDYIFDNSGYEIATENPNVEYILAIGKYGDLQSNIENLNIIGHKRIGNILIIKTSI